MTIFESDDGGRDYYCLILRLCPFVLLSVHKSFKDLLHSTGNCIQYLVIPGGSVGKESAFNAGDPGSIPGSGRSPREGNDNPFQYSCVENPMDRGAWQAIVHGVAKSRT